MGVIMHDPRVCDIWGCVIYLKGSVQMYKSLGTNRALSPERSKAKDVSSDILSFMTII